MRLPFNKVSKSRGENEKPSVEGIRLRGSLDTQIRMMGRQLGVRL